MEIKKESSLLKNDPDFPFIIAKQGINKNKIFSPPHYHEYLELIYISDGCLELEIGNQIEKLEKGDIAFIGGRTVHSTNNNDSDCINYVIYFDDTFFYSIKPNMTENKFVRAFLNTFGSKFSFKIVKKSSSTKHIDSIMDRIYYEYTEREIGFSLSIKGCFENFIVALLREGYVDMTEETPNDEHFEQVQHALKYIDNHYNEDISLTKLSEECNISYHYFSKIFRRVTGKNYKQYLDEVKVFEAERLMLQQNMSLLEVAYQIGIEDQSCFYRLYKRVRGYSPSEFKSRVKITGR